MAGRGQLFFFRVSKSESLFVVTQIPLILGVAFGIAAKQVALATLQFFILSREALQFTGICYPASCETRLLVCFRVFDRKSFCRLRGSESALLFRSGPRQ